MSRIAMFGLESQRIGGRCSANTPVLFCDGTNAAEALAEATRRQRRGERFLVAPVVDDTLSVISRFAAASILEQASTADQLRYYFEMLASGTLNFNDKPVNQHEIHQHHVVQTLREFSQMGEGLYVRSIVEQLRLEALFARKRSYVAVAPLLDPSVPNVKPSSDASRIVVWAPEIDAYLLGTYAYALLYIKSPVIFICRGRIDGSPHIFLGPEEGAAALAQARVVVDTQSSDPGTALAFTALGHSVAFAASTGAGEYVQGASAYAMHDFASISSAVTRMRGSRRSIVKPSLNASECVTQTLEAARPLLPENPPLVSIVVPTYNRPDELRKNLESLSLQTYPNFEVVVVNDCGEDVRDIGALFPFARYLRMSKNVGFAAASNFGLRVARGEFVGVLADDDRYFPNHLTALVTALITSGVDVAHGNVILRHETRNSEGELLTVGYRLDHDGDLDCFEVHWADTHINALTYLTRKETFKKTGFMNETLRATADIDSTIKLSKQTDFVHVNVVTGEMGCRDDRSSVGNSIGEGLATELHAVLRSHAPPDSEIISVRIETVCGSIAAAARAGETREKPWLPLAAPLAAHEI
jgi:hypothetical protein